MTTESPSGIPQVLDNWLGNASVAWPNPGARYRQYQLVQLLGAGAFSRVYLARDSEMYDRQVALKFTQRAASEIHALSRLQHPSLPAIYTQEQDLDLGVTVIAQSYFSSVSGQDFVAYAADPADPGSPWADVGLTHLQLVDRIVQDIAGALEVAHQQGVLHNDIKPPNLIINSQGQAQLIDFNSASIQEGPVSGEPTGTIPYLAPEVLHALAWGGAIPFTPQSDLYSLGITICELLTGQLPFLEESTADAAALLDAKILRQNLSRFIRGLPISRTARQALARALDPIPSRRQSSAREFLEQWTRRPLVRRVWGPVTRLTVISGALLALLVLFGKPQWEAVSPVVRAREATAERRVVDPPQLATTPLGCRFASQAYESQKQGDHARAVELYLQAQAEGVCDICVRNNLAFSRLNLRSRDSLAQAQREFQTLSHEPSPPAAVLANAATSELILSRVERRSIDVRYLQWLYDTGPHSRELLMVMLAAQGQGAPLEPTAALLHQELLTAPEISPLIEPLAFAAGAETHSGRPSVQSSPASAH